jgi:hypothetical protein
MDPFKQTIQQYLDNRAQTDSLFATTLAKENKNIDECVNYIYSEVQKSGRKGFTDDEIFGMAVHYYDEDDLKVSSANKPKVVVNHVVELSEEEKDRLKQQAADEYKNEVKAKFEKQFEKPAAAKKDKISKAQDAPSLNLFGDEDE